MGNFISTLQPFPAAPPAAASLISSDAPCAAAISRTIASPSPLPVPIVPGKRGLGFEYGLHQAG